MDWSILISLAALIVSFVVAIFQIKQQRQELRPFLSFNGTNGIVRILGESGQAGIDFLLNFKNVGKCVLCYEMMKFEIYVNGVQLPETDVKNKGSVIGVGAETVYKKYYKNYFQYQKEFDTTRYIPPDHKIVFLVEYYDIKRPKRRYKLSYEIFVDFEDGVKREIYGTTNAN